jgi:hypothetical protein
MVARVASGRPEQLRVPGLDEEQASRGLAMPLAEFAHCESDGVRAQSCR